MKIQHLHKIRKFYKQVQVIPNPSLLNNLANPMPSPFIASSSKYYGITLDNKILNTIDRHPMMFPNYFLAYAVAEEWASQDTHIRMGTMPLTLLHTQSARIQYEPAVLSQTTSDILSFLQDDQVCYDLQNANSINKYQEELVHTQKFLSGPIRKFMKNKFHIELPNYKTLHGNSKIDAQTINNFLKEQHPWVLNVIFLWTREFKSCSTALALLRNEIDYHHALDMAFLEENHQIKHYGLVEGAHDVTQALVTERTIAGLTYLKLLNS